MDEDLVLLDEPYLPIKLVGDLGVELPGRGDEPLRQAIHHPMICSAVDDRLPCEKLGVGLRAEGRVVAHLVVVEVPEEAAGGEEPDRKGCSRRLGEE